MLGVLHGQRDDWAEAERLIARAVEVDPSVAAAHVNLGNARRLLGRRDDALASYERALHLQPGHTRALKGRGLLLWESYRPAESLAVYEELLAIEPDYADGWIMRGACHDRLGRAEEAVASYRKALEFTHTSNPDKIRYVLASRGSGDLPDAAPVEYIRHLFDTYARRFDEHLLRHLEYRAPELLLAGAAAAPAADAARRARPRLRHRPVRRGAAPVRPPPHRCRPLPGDARGSRPQAALRRAGAG